MITVVRNIKRNCREFWRHVINYTYYKKKQYSFINCHADKLIIYIGIPTGPNLGDQTQKYCIRKWIASNFSDYKVVELPSRNFYDRRFSVLKSMERHICESDIIIFQSGYNVHDLAFGETTAKQIVMEAFPNNRILVMPQTVYFQHKKNMDEVSKSFNKANRLLFLARDRVSMEIAKEMMPSKTILLYPDVVTSLIGTYQFNNTRNGIFLCMRNDTEKYYDDNQINELIEKLKIIDNVSLGDTELEGDVNYIDRNIKSLLDLELEKYSEYRVIITDRYHGTIFSLIAGTPVIVLKTTDHKVITGAEWLKEVYDYVYIAESIDRINDLVENIYDNNVVGNPKPYFKHKYFDVLKKQFEEMI